MQPQLLAVLGLVLCHSRPGLGKIYSILPFDGKFNDLGTNHCGTGASMPGWSQSYDVFCDPGLSKSTGLYLTKGVQAAMLDNALPLGNNKFSYSTYVTCFAAGARALLHRGQSPQEAMSTGSCSSFTLGIMPDPDNVHTSRPFVRLCKHDPALPPDLLCTARIAPSTWYHLAVVYDGAVLHCFLNGVAVGTLEVAAQMAQSLNGDGGYLIGSSSRGGSEADGTYVLDQMMSMDDAHFPSAPWDAMSCGKPSSVVYPLTAVPATAVPDTDAPPTDVPETDVPTAVPDTNAPPTDAPDTNAPPTAVPDTDAPPTDVPATDAPPTAVPDTDAPPTAVPDTNAPPTVAPVVPDTGAPPTDVPTTDAPPTAMPDTVAPPTSVPDTDAPPVSVLKTNAPPTTVPDTDVPPSIPDTSAPPTAVPDTDAPPTNVPETMAPPTTTVPDTGAPPTDVPKTDAPPTSAPDTDAPVPKTNETTSVPDTNAPPTVAPVVPDTDAPPTDVPTTDAPPTAVPDTDAPPTSVPDTNVPSTNTQVTDAPSMPSPIPDTDAPPTKVPDTKVPPTDVPDTNAPPTTVPDTDAPSTNVPKTNAPPTVVPDTSTPPSTAVPDTNSPPTQAPPTSAPDTNAPPTNVPTTNIPPPAPPPTSAPPTAVPVTPPTSAPPTVAPETATPPTTGTPPGTDVPPSTAAPAHSPAPSPPVQAPAPQQPSPAERLGQALSDEAQEELETPITVAAVASFVSGAGAANSARLVVLASIGCRLDGIDLGDMLMDSALSWELHPTRLAIGTGAGRYLLGAAVANPLLLFCFAALGYAAAAAALQMGPGTGKARAHAVARFPGVLYVPYLFLLQGTTLAAAQLAFFPNRTGILPAVVGGVVLAACVAAPAGVFLHVLRHVPTRTRLVRDPALEGLHGLTRTVHRWAFSEFVFVSVVGRCAGNVDGYFPERYGIVFESLKEGRNWFVLSEQAVVLGLSLFSAWRPGGAVTCDVRNYLICLLLGIFFAQCLTRPYLSFVDNFFATAISGAMFLAVCLMSITITASLGTGSALSEVSLRLLQAASFFIMVKAVWDILVYLYDMRQARKEAVRSGLVPLVCDANGAPAGSDEGDGGGDTGGSYSALVPDVSHPLSKTPGSAELGGSIASSPSADLTGSRRSRWAQGASGAGTGGGGAVSSDPTDLLLLQTVETPTHNSLMSPIKSPRLDFFDGAASLGSISLGRRGGSGASKRQERSASGISSPRTRPTPASPLSRGSSLAGRSAPMPVLSPRALKARSSTSQLAALRL